MTPRKSITLLLLVVLITVFLFPVFAQAQTLPEFHRVVSGDSLWLLSNRYNVSITQIKQLNNLRSDTIYVGQALRLRPATQLADRGSTNIFPTPTATSKTHIVAAGDSLWKLSVQYGVTIQAIRDANNLRSDLILVGQRLVITGTGTSAPAPISNASSPSAITQWPSISYIVQAGDTVSGISRKFGVSVADILRFNYQPANGWFYAGEKIAINGFAPRQYAVVPGEASAPAQVGKLVDWFLDGKYILRSGEVFTIVDVATGEQFRVRMYGGSNHSDVEPLTAADTAIMYRLFGSSWTWTPRPVVIFKNGMNIAASLSGMPHDNDFIKNNNVTGHFDVYLYNSRPHGSSVSQTYVQQHEQAVLRAAGR